MDYNHSTIIIHLLRLSIVRGKIAKNPLWLRPIVIRRDLVYNGFEATMKSFQIRSKMVNGVAVLYLKGHLDAHQVARFEKELVRMIRESNFNILINGQELNYITSAGMGIIMGYIDEVREKGGDIKLCSLNERVHETFDLVGFTEIYDFVADEQAAIEKFNRVPPTA